MAACLIQASSSTYPVRHPGWRWRHNVADVRQSAVSGGSSGLSTPVFPDSDGDKVLYRDTVMHPRCGTYNLQQQGAQDFACQQTRQSNSAEKAMTEAWRVECTECADGSGLHLIKATNKADPSLNHQQKFRVVRGVTNLTTLTEERFDYIDKHVKYRKGDIIITSYPKCGTTWTEQCVLLLLNDGNKDALDPSHKTVYRPGSNAPGKLWPEASILQDPKEHETTGLEFAPVSIEEFDSAPDRRVIKSHARYEQLVGCEGRGLANVPEGVKVLIVSRNPLDACVSSYYHAFNPFKQGWTFDAWAAVFLSGKIMFGSYFEWVRGWWEGLQAHPDKGLWLQYEHMQEDARREIVRIAEFLDIPATDEIVDKVLQYSSFDSMKEQAQQKGGNHNDHLRKGKSGDWKNHFSPELVREFRERYNAEMAGTDLVYSIGEGEEPFAA
jgi:hypothetical protein